MSIGIMTIYITKRYPSDHISYYQGRIRLKYAAKGFCEVFIDNAPRWRDVYMHCYNIENTICGDFVGTTFFNAATTARAEVDKTLVYMNIFCSPAMLAEMRRGHELLDKTNASDPHRFTFYVEHLDTRLVPYVFPRGLARLRERLIP